MNILPETPCVEDGMTGQSVEVAEITAFPCLQPPIDRQPPPFPSLPTQSLIFSSPLYCIGCQRSLGSITFFMSGPCLLIARLTYPFTILRFGAEFQITYPCFTWQFNEYSLEVLGFMYKTQGPNRGCL